MAKIKNTYCTAYPGIRKNNLKKGRKRMINLKEKPFYLDDEDIAWVKKTLEGMTLEEKVGQLFCLIQLSDEDWRGEADFALRYQPAGIEFRPLKSEIGWTIANYYQGKSKIPMFIAANLERGGIGITKDGTVYGSNMQVAATNDPEMARKQGLICAREGKALGGNWSFAPCIDIDFNFRNPITNVRTYGSDPELVKQMGIAYIEALQGEGFAAAVKHFPGDGMDERDQHLVPTVNSMSCEEWDKTYGEAYKACIDAGVLTIMPGHIRHPEYSRRLRPGIADKDILPATMAPEILNDLLRQKLGFNGMIVSDSSTMVGMLTSMPREQAVPHVIAAGCDMYLFTRNMEEDYGYMMKGVQDGIITKERLEEALTRILATKAAIGLHEQQNKNKLVPPSANLSVLQCEEHKSWAKECSDKAITLVKSDETTLPLNPAKGKRMLLYVIGDDMDTEHPYGLKFPYFKEKLEKEGFEIDVFQPEGSLEMYLRRYDEVANHYDVILYYCALSTKSNQTTVRINWLAPMGCNSPIYVASVPTVFISMENPYHLLDVPQVQNYINTYANSYENIDALVEKLMGRSTFKGKSPVDSFCGKWDTRI